MPVTPSEAASRAKEQLRFNARRLAVGDLAPATIEQIKAQNAALEAQLAAQTQPAAKKTDAK